MPTSVPRLKRLAGGIEQAVVTIDEDAEVEEVEVDAEAQNNH